MEDKEEKHELKIVENSFLNILMRWNSQTSDISLINIKRNK